MTNTPKQQKPLSATLPIETIIARSAARRAQRISLDEMRRLRTCVWDIEAGGLDANYDVMLCATIKPLAGKCRTFRIGRPVWDDRKLCTQVRDELAKYDCIIHHYGDRYDIPFLQTRLLLNHQPLLKTANQIFVDTWWTARKRYKFNSNRLATIIDALGTPTHKTPLNGPIWIKAKAGDTASLKYIIEHNVADVIALQEITEVLATAEPLKYSYRK